LDKFYKIIFLSGNIWKYPAANYILNYFDFANDFVKNNKGEFDMDNELFILWTNADEITFEKMVCMYAKNSLKHQWWEKVTIIIWGSTAKFTAESELVQENIKQLLHIGITVSACKSCTDQLGVSAQLEKIGIEVKYWGKDLTEIIKNNKKLLTI
jgi:hypothetical protein